MSVLLEAIADDVSRSVENATWLPLHDGRARPVYKEAAEAILTSVQNVGTRPFAPSVKVCDVTVGSKSKV